MFRSSKKQPALFLPVAAVIIIVGVGCGAPPQKEGKYPPLKPGCEVQVFKESPPYQTENIGPVQATCDQSIPDSECMQTLKDQACKLGADTIWGVENPTLDLGKKKLLGRAAHQK